MAATIERDADTALLVAITRRACFLYANHGHADTLERMNRLANELACKLALCHFYVVPLRLAEMLDSDTGNFLHDVAGIRRHLDVKRRRMNDCFLPRFARLNATSTRSLQ